MDQGLQKLNADQRLAVWTQRIAECRSSGTSVKSWCRENGVSEKTYYYWQRRIFKLAQEQQTPELRCMRRSFAVSFSNWRSSSNSRLQNS